MVRTILLAITTLALASGAAAQPDLVVGSLDTSATSTDTQTLAISGSLDAQIANAGDVATASSFSVRAFEDRNGNGLFDGAPDVLLGTATVSGPLTPLSTTSVLVTLSGEVLFAGNLIHVEADAGGAIGESDETNNIRSTGEDSQFIPPAGRVQSRSWSGRGRRVRFRAERAERDDDAFGHRRVGQDGVPDVVFGATASRGRRLGGGGVPARAERVTDGSELFTVDGSVAAGEHCVVVGDGRHRRGRTAGDRRV